MKNIRVILALASAFVLSLASCKKYDDSFLRSEVDSVQQKLENLVRTVGENEEDIATLQTLIQALQQRNYIVGIDPQYELVDGTSKAIGYNIRFQNDTEILVKHGSSQFKAFDYDIDYVYMTLADGTRVDIERAPVGAIKHAFSVSGNKKVYFSRGNLQYNCRTGAWRFAEHQYDVIGTESNTKDVGDPKYFGWISYFAWATSGYHDSNDNYNTRYMPYEHSVENTGESNNPTGYGPSYVNSSTNLSLVGTYANYDWGVNNAISNGGNQKGMWRTPTYTEWNYLLTGRANASQKLGAATVNGTTGFVLLPDEFELPDTLTFASEEEVGLSLAYTDNVYTANQWKAMERLGAVLLPAEGRSYGTGSVDNFGINAFYQTASAPTGSAYKDRSIALLMLISNSAGKTDIYTNSGSRQYCCSVRLVQDITE